MSAKKKSTAAEPASQQTDLTEQCIERQPGAKSVEAVTQAVTASVPCETSAPAGNAIPRDQMTVDQMLELQSTQESQLAAAREQLAEWEANVAELTRTHAFDSAEVEFAQCEERIASDRVRFLERSIGQLQVDIKNREAIDEAEGLNRDLKATRAALKLAAEAIREAERLQIESYKQFARAHELAQVVDNEWPRSKLLKPLHEYAGSFGGLVCRRSGVDFPDNASLQFQEAMAWLAVEVTAGLYRPQRKRMGPPSVSVAAIPPHFAQQWADLLSGVILSRGAPAWVVEGIRTPPAVSPSASSSPDGEDESKGLAASAVIQ